MTATPTAAGLTGALCAGQWELFDSVDLRDHLAARQLCVDCPIIAACHQTVRECYSIQKGAGPIGTWAGRLYGRSGGQIRGDIECGSDSGYYRHRHLGETACMACRVAHAAESAQVRGRNRTRVRGRIEASNKSGPAGVDAPVVPGLTAARSG